MDTRKKTKKHRKRVKTQSSELKKTKMYYVQCVLWCGADVPTTIVCDAVTTTGVGAHIVLI